MASESQVRVHDIVKKYLEENGYEGLCGEECGCELADLFPCGGDWALECVPGYKVPCDPEKCPNGGGCAWHMSPQKSEK